MSEQMTVYAAGEWTPAERADYIAEPMGDAVAAFVEISRRLNEQKDATPHGEWGNVVALLPWSERTTQALMTLVRNEAIANPHHGADLPPSWRTLSVLARVPADELDDLIDRGEVNADMERATAQAIADQYNAARIADLNEYSRLVDDVSAALAAANERRAWPADLSDQYQPPAVLIERARSLVTRLESL